MPSRPRALSTLALAVALTPSSCSRPNPLWGDTDAGASSSTTSDPVTTAADASTSESTGSGGSSGATDSTTAEPTTTQSGTSGGDPLCGDFAGDPIQINLALDEAACNQGVTGYGKVTYIDSVPSVIVCLLPGCNGCTSIILPLDAEAKWLTEGACLTGRHEGIWLPGDPEAPTKCKTTGFLLYDNDPIHPLYIASSRVFAHPSTIEPSLAFNVDPVNDEVCACPPDTCCVDDQATRFDIRLEKDGATVTVALGNIPLFNLDNKLYAVQLLRGHKRGYQAGGTCQGAIDFVDWQMVRLSP